MVRNQFTEHPGLLSITGLYNFPDMDDISSRMAAEFGLRSEVQIFFVQVLERNESLGKLRSG
jgi:hypothetical protein